MSRAVLDVLTTSRQYGDVCRRHVKMLGRTRIRHFDYRNWEEIDWPKVARAQSTPLLVISRVADIPVQIQKPYRRARFGSKVKRFLFFTGQMPPEALPSRVSQLNIRNPGRLHIANTDDEERAERVIARTIQGLAKSQSDRIVDAWWEGSVFVVLSPGFQRLAVPLAMFSRLIGDDPDLADEYEVDVDGSFVYWPHADVHLGWRQFLRMVDPVKELDARAEHEEFNVRYGVAIRGFRKARGMRQSDIPGLTARQVGRIERGKCRATRSALSKLASAHGLVLPEYLGKLAERLG